jgi:hypothetical protein
MLTQDLEVFRTHCAIPRPQQGHVIVSIAGTNFQTACLPPASALSQKGLRHLSLLKTRFERIDGGARQGSDMRQHPRTARSVARRVCPSQAKREFILIGKREGANCDHQLQSCSDSVAIIEFSQADKVLRRDAEYHNCPWARMLLRRPVFPSRPIRTLSWLRTGRSRRRGTIKRSLGHDQR